MDILTQFGVEPVLLVAQIINFLIVFFILKKVLYQPILDTLKTREKTIKEGYKQAEEAKVLYEHAAEKEKEILKKAQTEAKQLIQEAKAQSSTLLAESEEKTRIQVEKMLAEGRALIAQDSEKARKQLNAQIVQLAESVLGKSLEGFFSEKEQETVMKNATKQLKVD